MMDSEKIKLVMINLLSNALKFTPEGGTVIISARKDGSNMRVEVKDTGSGIPQDDINRIFDKFQQVDMPINRKQSGTGLGLSIARHIVDAHKGKIWAESKLGSGSTFTVLLPLRIT
jgi:signal transduction histidine kinase